MSDHEFERRVATALHAGVETSAGARERIMARVRGMPAGERPRRRVAREAHRTWRHSIAGVALAAGVGSISALSSLVPQGRAAAPRAVVIGDSVSATLRDTLRLVRLIFDDTTARSVAAVGDFNAWRAGTTPLVREQGSRRWSATVAMRDGAQRYAFVVDGTRWVIDPAAEHVRGVDGRLLSLLHVARATN